MEHLGVSYVENHDLCLVLLLVYDRFLKIEVYFILVYEKSPGLIERGCLGSFYVAGRSMDILRGNVS